MRTEPLHEGIRLVDYWQNGLITVYEFSVGAENDLLCTHALTTGFIGENRRPRTDSMQLCKSELAYTSL